MENDTDKPTGDGKEPEAQKAQATQQGKEEEPKQKTVEDIITELEGQTQALEKVNRDLKDRLLRTAADFDNFQKRAKKEIEEGASKGRESVVKEILPVLDNLERALKHASDTDPLAQGVKMVEKQLLSALEKYQVSRFSALGQAFDPALHDAIQQVETNEVPPGTVATEYSRGYMMGGKLLRPAMVAVAKAPGGAAPQEEQKE
jgi:molecular chaperone GrpE